MIGVLIRRGDTQRQVGRADGQVTAEAGGTSLRAKERQAPPGAEGTARSRVLPGAFGAARPAHPRLSDCGPRGLGESELLLSEAFQSGALHYGSPHHVGSGFPTLVHSHSSPQQGRVAAQPWGEAKETGEAGTWGLQPLVAYPELDRGTEKGAQRIGKKDRSQKGDRAGRKGDEGETETGRRKRVTGREKAGLEVRLGQRDRHPDG